MNDKTEELAQYLHDLLRHFNPAASQGYSRENIGQIAEEFLGEAASQRWISEQMAQTKLKTMDFRNGITMELEPAQDLLAGFVAAARTFLKSAENYSEMTFADAREDPNKLSYSMGISIPELPERYTLTVQRVAPGKLTPHEARAKAEAERDKLLEIINEFCIEYNNSGGIDAGDLAYRTESAGFEFPPDED